MYLPQAKNIQIEHRVVSEFFIKKLIQWKLKKKATVEIKNDWQMC